jgi:uracil-DNA glycosylase family 4
MADMDKGVALRALEDEMTKDASLPLAGRANLVFGEGDPDCAVMFIGEAPGYNEDVERRPFVGRAGQLLRQAIRELGWKESGVYITNIVKRRPPENRDPSPEEIEAYRPYLARQIEIIAPRAIVPLGRFATNYFLPDAKITRDQGRAFRVGERLVIPMLHPAAALRAPTVLETFQATFRKLPALLRGEGAVELPPARPTAKALEETSRQRSLF